MLIKSIRVKKSYIVIGMLTLLILLIISFIIIKSIVLANEDEQEKNYIKWVDYNVPLEVMEKIAKLDINSHTKEGETELNWIELLSYLASKYGGNFKSFKQKDLDNVVERLNNGETIEDITKDMKLYAYYIEAYTAILDQFIGDYQIELLQEDGTKIYKEKYGIKAFLPIAKNYGFSHYDDFGNSRSYGYKRLHLGNDLMGSIGTPIIAVESGIVEACRMESIWRLENWN